MRRKASLDETEDYTENGEITINDGRRNSFEA